ncbi:GNAT family N-acetyltransferase [Streptomyces sp. NPDC096324]|uniref:GNAT family N-acetyltransferase n=1 Tax=Streptomyces sp. NPDC096324 TaxID=3366085 RepID=UPI003818E725
MVSAKNTDNLAPRLTSTGDAQAFVIDAPDGTLAACTLSLVSPVLPAPSYPRARAARVQLVVTHPAFRRRGYARAVVAALLDHLTAEDTTLFELHTSPQAAPLYRNFSFSGSPALMRMTRRSTSAPASAGTGGGYSWVPPEQYAQSLPKAVAFVCLYITDEDDHPLQLHSVYSPSHPWHMIGGALDLGETPWDAAVRECREETGLNIAGPPRLLAPAAAASLQHSAVRLRRRPFEHRTDPPHRPCSERARRGARPASRPVAGSDARIRLRAPSRGRGRGGPRAGAAGYFDTWGNT